VQAASSKQHLRTSHQFYVYIDHLSRLLQNKRNSMKQTKENKTKHARTHARKKASKQASKLASNETNKQQKQRTAPET
jgi:hypothetical protein